MLETVSINQKPNRFDRLWTFWRSELAYYPYRMNMVWRLLVSSLIALVMFNALQIPLSDLSLVLIFIITKDCDVVSQKAAVGSTLGTLIFAVVTFLLFKLSINTPLLRLILVSLACFGAFFLVRTFKMGPVFSISAMFLIFAQSWVDQSGSAEELTRKVLWMCAAIFSGIAIATIVNTLLLPASPKQVIEGQILLMVSRVKKVLGALLKDHGKIEPISDQQFQRDLMVLHKMMQIAAIDGKKHEPSRDFSNSLPSVTAIARMMLAASQIKGDVEALALSEADRQAIQQLLHWLEQLSHAVVQGRNFSIFEAEEPVFLQINRSIRAPLISISHALFEVGSDKYALLDESTVDSKAQPSAPKAKWFVDDAWSNPVYLQYSAKTLLAVLICYCFFTVTQWPAIHTCVFTVMLIALPSVGASLHKGTLRFAGTLLGSLIAFAYSVFVLPHVTSIVGLLFTTLPILALGGYINAGSERTAYLGVQMVIAFALAIFVHLGPSYDLTEIRDRLIGVIVGIVVSTLIHSYLWPEKSDESLRKCCANVFRSIANVMPVPTELNLSDRVQWLKGAKIKVWNAFEQSQTVLNNVAFETGLYRHPHGEDTFQTQLMLNQLRQFYLSLSHLQQVYYIHGTGFSQPIVDALKTYREALQTFLLARAERLINNSETPMPALPDVSLLKALCSQPHSFEYGVLLPSVEDVQQNLQAVHSWDVNLKVGEVELVSPAAM